jgi:NAD(P)-dependent dehydrogenase (short-subunit alcohol dehydrogenase family)/CMP-N-acetylneuraminic acid synthetase
MKVAVIIPIKYNSSRVPGKNFKLLNGKPLFYYIIQTLLECKYVKYIIINTDSEKIKEKILNYFKFLNPLNLIFYNRPPELVGDEVSTNKIIEDTLKNVNFNGDEVDLYLQTHVTNPLLSTNTIISAIEKYIEVKDSKDSNDSLFSVKTWHTRLYNKEFKAINHNIDNLIQTQDLDPIYEENSCIYIFTKESFLNNKNRIGKTPYLFKMNNYESQDIDWEHDFYLTELMLMSKYIDLPKVVIITGINGGIGSFLGYYFKSKKWTVIGLDIIDELKGVDLNYDMYYKCDISNEEDIKRVVNELAYYNKIDVIVNNAAYQLCKKLVDSSSAEWDKVINSNLKSVFLLTKYLYPKLKEAKGSIINISSVHATHTSQNIGIYATSKGGLTTLTRSMAIEFGKDKIRVNAILPGAINTGMLRAGLKRGHLGDDTEDELVNILGSKHILGKIGEPSDIAEMTYFLANNDKSSFITGQSFYVDGGATIKLSTE